MGENPGDGAHMMDLKNKVVLCYCDASSIAPMYFMKILLIGSWQHLIYAKSFEDAFIALGHEVLGLECITDFNTTHPNKLIRFVGKVQERLLVGWPLRCVQQKILNAAFKFQPDLIFCYRARTVLPSTLKKIRAKRPGVKIVCYNNDDPFTKSLGQYYWRNYPKKLPYYDHVFVFRHKNVEDLKRLGYENVSLLRGYAINALHFPLEIQKDIDVIFIGHYEHDGRDELIKYLMEQGVDIQLYGISWRRSKHYHYFRKKLGREIYPVYGEDYNRMLNRAKIALVLFSHINSDTYTSRVFEIPATKTMMLAPDNNDMRSMFEADVEAVYYQSAIECHDKIQNYLSDERYCAIAEAGHQRFKKDKHEAVDRCEQVLSELA